MSGVRGRRITSSVHNYFKILDEKNDDGKVLAACQINDKSGKVCGTIVSSADYATNLKHHLNKVHPDIFGIVKKADAEKPKKENSKDSDLSQQTLKQAFFGQKKYEKSSVENRNINKAIALFFGGSNVPVSTVENTLFRNLVVTLDNRYQIPGRKKVNRLISDLRHQLDTKMKQLLLEAKRITVTTDLWTKCDLTPFMGVTAHFYNRKDHQRYNVVLALRELPHPHTGDNIYNALIDVLNDWGVDISKVFKAVTDNAANMIKAFRDQPGPINAIDEIDLTDEESCEEDDFCADANLDESFIDNEEDEYDNLQEAQQTLWKKKHLGCIQSHPCSNFSNSVLFLFC